MKKHVRPAAIGFAVIGLILLSTGLGLWADVPGPKPDRDVRVVSFKPQGTTGSAVNISITFSNSLVPPDSLNRPTKIVPVRISPEIDGLARWTATDILTIYPGKPLDPATDYRATVIGGGDYVNGNRIRRDQQFEFHTPTLSIDIPRYQAQRSREQSSKARLVFDLDFNYPVNRERLKEAISIKGRENASKSNLSVAWPDTAFDGKELPTEAKRFRLATELFDLRDGDQRYQLNIDKALRCVNCGEGLSVNFTYNMAVPKNPRLDLRVEEVAGADRGSA
jgi:hypothetical protein